MNLIEKFSEVFVMPIKDWEFWKEEHGCSDILIIAGPSRIVGLVDLNKIEEKIEWETYSTKTTPTKKMTGNFVYNKGMYSIDFLEKIFKFLDEIVEISRHHEAILFKLTESIALGLGEKINPDDFYYNDEGVMFIEWEWETTKKDWRTVVKEKEFIKWENNIAQRKHKGKANIWYECVYRFEYFFEEEEDMGDMMLL